MTIIDLMKTGAYTIEGKGKVLLYVPWENFYFVLDQTSTDEEMARAIEHPYYVGRNFEEALAALDQ